MKSIFLLLVFASAFAYSEEPKARFVRIAKIEGRAQILRYGLKEWEDAAVNMILSEGDRLYTDDRGSDDHPSYAEIQFDNGTAVTLNNGTEIEIVDLTREIESGEELTSLYVASGDVKVRVPRYYQPGKTFNLETPHGMVSIEEESSARININNRTEVILYKGRANALSEKGNISIIGGERTFIEKGESPKHPEQINKIESDRFDEWSIEREKSDSGSRKYISEDIVIGVDELDSYGKWVYIHPYGWVWRPRTYFGWRPYFYGHWEFTERWGWVWVSYEPWGWIPYHYGRWAYCWPYGWVWIPGRVWGPCWVVWYDYPGWVGWSPMGPCDGPWFSCSVHFSFGSKWVWVTKESFKHYKYSYQPCKSYREYKPYQYRDKLPKEAEIGWSRRAPDIRPEHAKKTSLVDNKPIVGPQNKEILSDRKSIRPTSNRAVIPSPERNIPSPERSIPSPERNIPSSERNIPERKPIIDPGKALPPDKDIPHSKNPVKEESVNPSKTKSRNHFIPSVQHKVIPNRDRSVEEKSIRVVSGFLPRSLQERIPIAKKGKH